MTTYEKLYIGGDWTRPAGTSTIDVYSASTEELLGTVPEGTFRDVDAAVTAARRAFNTPGGWSEWPVTRRAEVLNRFAELLENVGDETARRVSAQNGMPITIANQIESTFPPMLLRYYAALSVQTSEEEKRPGLLGSSALVIRRPIGVVAAIVPWNAPQALTFLKLAPALAAGATVVIKPSPETVLDAFLLAETAIDAGLPEGVLNIVPGGAELGAYLVSHPGVDKVAFTGSTAAGRSVGEICGRLLRPVTLELGGKSAAIVLDDADLESAAQAFFASTLLNNGQVCWLGTRVLAPRSRYNEVVDFASDLARSLTIGDALDPTTQLGPLVSTRQRSRVEGYIEKGLAEGARLTAGGGRPTGFDRGWFLEATIFADVDNRQTVAREEIFGPVVCVIPYDSEDDALAIAADSEYGLGGTVWTSDPERGEALASRLDSGSVGINGYINDPVAPIGGVRASGLGYELGPEGLASYQSLKTVYLDAATRPSAAHPG